MSFLDSTRISRRKAVLGSAAIFAAAPLGGYGIVAAQDSSPVAGGDPEDQLEIFSWWTTAGDR